MERLFETYKEYFRVGAAVSGIFYDEEGFLKKHQAFVEFMKTHPRPAGMPEFKIHEPPKGPFPDLDILKRHFNLVVAENDTKPGNMNPAEGVYNFESADKFIKLAKDNNQDIRWHTLLWHSQAAEWMFKNEDGSDVSKELLEERLKNYIFTIGNRYSKDICSVDVVNECISDKKFTLRDEEDHSKWLKFLGPDYVDKAFLWAKEAFPNSSLVINDYNLEIIPEKRMGMYNLVKGMLKRGIPVDTVGLQMHINMERPAVSEIEKTIELYGSLGLNVIVTEMDVSVYADFQPGKESEPRKEYTKELLEKQAERYYELFECFKKESKAGILKDVVLWGITDRFSWKNNFPVPDRTDAPLLFDVNGNPKPAFDRLIKPII
ncbi:MAG: endo-1,4-beta-xylanase [Treponema sp.]|nr:endo-1,4-beta-xylanase [Treponema sp.]